MSSRSFQALVTYESPKQFTIERIDDVMHVAGRAYEQVLSVGAEMERGDDWYTRGHGNG